SESDLKTLDAFLAACCETLRWAALMVAPAMPTAAREILRQLGRERDVGSWPQIWRWPGGTLTEPKPIYPRIEPERQADLIARWSGAATDPVPAVAQILPGKRRVPDAASPPENLYQAAAEVLLGKRPPPGTSSLPENFYQAAAEVLLGRRSLPGVPL